MTMLVSGRLTGADMHFPPPGHRLGIEPAGKILGPGLTGTVRLRTGGTPGSARVSATSGFITPGTR